MRHALMPHISRARRAQAMPSFRAMLQLHLQHQNLRTRRARGNPHEEPPTKLGCDTINTRCGGARPHKQVAAGCVTKRRTRIRVDLSAIAHNFKPARKSVMRECLRHVANCARPGATPKNSLFIRVQFNWAPRTTCVTARRPPAGREQSPPGRVDTPPASHHAREPPHSAVRSASEE